MATGGEENPTESKAAFDEFLTEVIKKNLLVQQYILLNFCR